jgi:hypothetical protein
MKPGQYEHTGWWVELRFLPEQRVTAVPITGEVQRLVLVLDGRMNRVQI